MHTYVMAYPPVFPFSRQIGISRCVCSGEQTSLAPSLQSMGSPLCNWSHVATPASSRGAACLCFTHSHSLAQRGASSSEDTSPRLFPCAITYTFVSGSFRGGVLRQLLAPRDRRVHTRRRCLRPTPRGRIEQDLLLGRAHTEGPPVHAGSRESTADGWLVRRLSAYGGRRDMRQPIARALPCPPTRSQGSCGSQLARVWVPRFEGGTHARQANRCPVQGAHWDKSLLGLIPVCFRLRCLQRNISI
ncbi:hypothetical protein C8Q70DRAFT_280006 [Cubamyces menziesii]|nr:hypothetical protein C8Q70DRAFT_280006 [Cubamyces menziesii]